MKRIRIVCFLSLMLLFLSACSIRNVSRGQAEGEAYDAVISVNGSREVMETAEAAEGTEEAALSVDPQDEAAMEQLKGQLMALTKLVGADDETAAGLLGGGEENRTEDDAVLVGRIYRTEVFYRTCSVYTSYDAAGLVCMVVVELAEQNAGDYEALLTALFGEASRPEEEETREASRFWESGGYRFTLYEFEDGVSLDVNWAHFE